MAVYRRVYDSRHLQADCQEPGSAPEPYARHSSMGSFYLFYTILPAYYTQHTHTMCTRILGRETEEASKLCAIVSTRQTVGAHPFLAHARHDKTVVPACRPPPPRRRPGRQLRLAARPPTRSDVVYATRNVNMLWTAAYD